MVEVLHAEEVVECRVRQSRSRRSSSGGSSSHHSAHKSHTSCHRSKPQEDGTEAKLQDGQSSVATLSLSARTPPCVTTAATREPRERPASCTTSRSASTATTTNTTTLTNAHSSATTTLLLSSPPPPPHSARDRKMDSYSRDTAAVPAMAVHVPGEPDVGDGKDDSRRHKGRAKRKKVTTILVPMDVDQVLQASQPRAMRAWMEGEAAQQIMHNTKHHAVNNNSNNNSNGSNNSESVNMSNASTSMDSSSRISNSHAINGGNNNNNNTSGSLNSARQGSSVAHHTAPPPHPQAHAMPPEHVVQLARKAEDGKAHTSTAEHKLPPIAASPSAASATSASRRNSTTSTTTTTAAATTATNRVSPRTVTTATAAAAGAKDKDGESKASVPRKPVMNGQAAHGAGAQAASRERTAAMTNSNGNNGNGLTRPAPTQNSGSNSTSAAAAAAAVPRRQPSPQPRPLAAIAGTDAKKPSTVTTTTTTATAKANNKEEGSSSSSNNNNNASQTSRALHRPHVLSSRLLQPVTAHLSPSPSPQREANRDSVSLSSQLRTPVQPPPPRPPPPPPLPTHNTGNANITNTNTSTSNSCAPGRGEVTSNATAAEPLRPVPPYMLNKIKTAPSIVHGGLPTLGMSSNSNSNNNNNNGSDHSLLSQGLASAPSPRTTPAIGCASNNNNNNSNTQTASTHVHVMDSGSRLPGSHRHYENDGTGAPVFIPVAKTESSPLFTRSTLVFADAAQAPLELPRSKATSSGSASAGGCVSGSNKDEEPQKPAGGRASFGTMQDYALTEAQRERLRQRHDSAPAALHPTIIAPPPPPPVVVVAATTAATGEEKNNNSNSSSSKDPSGEVSTTVTADASAARRVSAAGEAHKAAENMPRVSPAASHSYATAERRHPTPTPPHLAVLRTPPSVSVYRRPRTHSPLTMTAFITHDGRDYASRTGKALPGLTHVPQGAASQTTRDGANDTTTNTSTAAAASEATGNGTLAGNTSVLSSNGRTMVATTTLMRPAAVVAPVRSTRRGWTAGRIAGMNSSLDSNTADSDTSAMSDEAKAARTEEGGADKNIITTTTTTALSPRHASAGGQYRRSSLFAPPPESAGILAPTPLTQLPTFADRSHDALGTNNNNNNSSSSNDEEEEEANGDGSNNNNSNHAQASSTCGESGGIKWASPLGRQHRSVGSPSFSSVPASSSTTSNNNNTSATSRNDVGRRSTSTSGPAVSIVAPSEKEQLALSQYLHAQELNLSMSTFTCIGSTLSRSHALRVLNLRGCTMASEGLRGLADIPTLRVICLANMRYLTTLEPLLTPSAGHVCLIEELDAHCTPLKNDGIRTLAALPHLRRLDLSMTAVSEVGFLAQCSTTRQPAVLEELAVAVTLVDSDGLAGLEKIATLRTLNISRSRVTSLASLVQSRSLETLLLYSCKVTDEDIAGIERMPRLSRLDLSTTKVTDLSVLRASRSLRTLKAQWLTLKNCYDIIQERRALLEGFLLPEALLSADELEAGYAGLAEIPTLETLDLSFNTLRSIRSLCASRSLRHLILRRTRVDHNGVAAIAALAATLETLVITNLAELADAEAELSDEDDGSNMARASSNSSSSNYNNNNDDSTGNNATSYGHAAEASTPSASSMRTTLLNSVTAIAALTRLRRLDLSYTDVYDLRLLRDLGELRELVLVETLVTEDGLRGVEKIAALELLDLSQTSVMSLQFLYGGAGALRTLLLKSNRNERGFHLGPVHRLPALRHLDLSDTVVEDAYRLSEEPWPLQSLVWRWGERREVAGPVPALVPCCVTAAALAGLNKLPDLQRLDLSHTAIAALDFLRYSASLRQVNLSGCRELSNESLHALGQLPRLEVVNVSGVANISDVGCLARAARLREVYLADTSVTVAGVEAVAQLASLQVLDIAHTKAEETVLADVTGTTGGSSSNNNTKKSTSSNSGTSPGALQDGGRPSSAQMLALACAVKFPARRRSDSSHFSLEASASAGLSEFNASSCTSGAGSHGTSLGVEDGGGRASGGRRGSCGNSAGNVSGRNSLASLNGMFINFASGEPYAMNSGSGSVKRLNASGLLVDGLSAGIGGVTAAPMHFRIPRRRRVSFVEAAAAGTPTRHSAAVTLHTRKAM